MTREEWMDHLRTAFEDADAAARDMLRSPRKQALGHRQHRRLYGDAAATMRHLLDHPPDEAPASPPPDPPPPEPRDPDALRRAALDTPFETRRHLPPLERARQKLLYFFTYAPSLRVQGALITEIDSIVPDIVAAAVAEMRPPRDAAPAAPPA